MTKTVYYYKQDGTLANIELTGIMLSEQLPVATLYVNGHLINFYWQSDVSYDDFVEQGYLLSEGKELADFYHVKFLVFYASEEIAKKQRKIMLVDNHILNWLMNLMQLIWNSKEKISCKLNLDFCLMKLNPR